MSKIIGVIHARGGSKRIPLKNIKELNGQPLISYTIKAALASKYLERVIVSTDHPEIKRISLACGAEVPFDRPAAISEDVASELVTQHAVNFIEDKEKSTLDIVVTLQPTSPFSTGADIDKTIDLLIKNPNLNSAISVKEIVERPEWMFYKEGDAITSYAGTIFSGDVGVSQTLPKLYVPNGAVYATRRSALFGENALICKKCGGHVMSREQSVDIDVPLDFVFAEFVAKNYFNK
ncbi:MAG: acylneuraminate cytidylyltransferase family protein [Deltaproteobacteria bacterium]|nr:acylneuraminate cytidylyltransferase family protein [Deltaproteobacteria bacterium]